MEVSCHLHAPTDLPARKKPLPMKSRLSSPQNWSVSFREGRIPARIRTPDRPDHSLVIMLSTFFPNHSHTKNACSRPNVCRVVRTANFNISAYSWTIDNL